MKNWKNKFRARLTDEEIQRYLKFLAIPFVAAILIGIIIAVDKPNEQPAVSQETVTSGSEATAESTDAGQTKPAYPAHELNKDAVPEIRALTEAYLQARRDCDATALNEVFGGLWPGEILSQRQAELNENVRLIEDYQNLVCYTKPGLNAEEYVVYACFDIKFREVETAAPTIIVCYAKKNAQGSYYFEEKSTGKTAEYISAMNQSADVQLIVKRINSSLRDALEADDGLLRVYDELMAEAAANSGEESREADYGTAAASEDTTAADVPDSTAENAASAP